MYQNCNLLVQCWQFEKFSVEIDSNITYFTLAVRSSWSIDQQWVPSSTACSLLSAQVVLMFSLSALHLCPGLVSRCFTVKSVHCFLKNPDLDMFTWKKKGVCRLKQHHLFSGFFCTLNHLNTWKCLNLYGWVLNWIWWLKYIFFSHSHIPCFCNHPRVDV